MNLINTSYEMAIQPTWDSWSQPQQVGHHPLAPQDRWQGPDQSMAVDTPESLVVSHMAAHYTTASAYYGPASSSMKPYPAAHIPSSLNQYGQPEGHLPMPCIPTHPQHGRFRLPPLFLIPQQHTQGHQRPAKSPSVTRSGPMGAPEAFNTKSTKNIIYNKPIMTDDAVFRTPVDIMMKAIQKRKDMDMLTSRNSSGDGAGNLQPESDLSYLSTSEHDKKRGPEVNRYKCPYDDCPQSFRQKAHLKTHERAHTGAKPYSCEWPGCDRRFSQPGNLKTHTRLHRGERPYECDSCGASFAQGGNLAAHKQTHNKAKPFFCRLKSCNKVFSTRGNLKKHQNRYHKQIFDELADQIVSGTLPPEKHEQLKHLADTFQNSNKGIKGRGKDRRVSTSRMGKKPSRLPMPTRPTTLELPSAHLGLRF